MWKGRGWTRALRSGVRPGPPPGRPRPPVGGLAAPSFGLPPAGAYNPPEWGPAAQGVYPSSAPGGPGYLPWERQVKLPPGSLCPAWGGQAAPSTGLRPVAAYVPPAGVPGVCQACPPLAWAWGGPVRLPGCPSLERQGPGPTCLRAGPGCPAGAAAP